MARAAWWRAVSGSSLVDHGAGSEPGAQSAACSVRTLDSATPPVFVYASGAGRGGSKCGRCASRWHVESAALVPRPVHATVRAWPRWHARGPVHGVVRMCDVRSCSYEMGHVVYLRLSTSAYNYHMQYTHGVCARALVPFAPPAAVCARTVVATCATCTECVPLGAARDEFTQRCVRATGR